MTLLETDYKFIYNRIQSKTNRFRNKLKFYKGIQLIKKTSKINITAHNMTVKSRKKLQRAYGGCLGFERR